MTFTSTITADNTALHAIVCPAACARMTLREAAQDASPVAYDVAAPQSSNPTFRKYPAESTEFSASAGGYIASGATVGFIQPTAGTVTFTLICE